MTGWIVLGVLVFILALLVLYVIVVYNGLVRLKNNIEKSWSNIDVLLKQRTDQCEDVQFSLSEIDLHPHIEPPLFLLDLQRNLTAFFKAEKKAYRY